MDNVKLNGSVPAHRYYRLLIGVCWVIYTAMVAAKMAFTAQIAEIIGYFNITRSQAAAPVTYYYIVYAVMEFVVSFYIGRIDLKKYFAITFAGSAGICFLLPLSTAIGTMSLLLAVSGILHAGVWGGCLRILSKYVPEQYNNKINITMSTGFAAGTFLAYGAAAGFIAFLSWKATFIFFGVILLVSAAAFYLVNIKIEKKLIIRQKSDINQIIEGETVEKQQKTPLKKQIYFLTLLALPMLFSCSLYYGTVNWLPNLLFEVYGVSVSYSLMITLLVPVLILFGPIIMALSCKSRSKIMKVNLIYTLAVLPVFPLLAFVYDANIIVALVLSAAAAIIVRGTTNMLGATIPLSMKGLINSGTSASVLNSVASMGASLAPFFVGVAIDKSGWRAAYLLMTAICACAALSMVAVLKIWKKNFKN